jgi:hypothetical protein
MKNKILISLSVVVLLILGVVFPRGNSVVQQIVGANPGPDSMSPYSSFNGVTYWYNRVVMKTASSTLCSIKSPAATSTLVSATALFTKTATYATVYELGWDTTRYSTTTALGTTEFSIGANSMGTIIGSTTAVMMGQSGVVPPSTYINLKLSTSTVGASATFAPTGDCIVVFQEL